MKASEPRQRDGRVLLVDPAGAETGAATCMAGSCQRTWEHCVPKTAQPTGPRISVQFRPHGVR